MSMGYIVYREDLDNESEIQYTVDNNPDMYPMGTVIQTKDGDAWIVVFNDGVTVTLQLINNGGTSNLWANDVDNPNGGIVNTDQDNNNSVRVVGNLGVGGSIPQPWSTFISSYLSVGGRNAGSIWFESDTDTIPVHVGTIFCSQTNLVLRQEEAGDIVFQTGAEDETRLIIRGEDGEYDGNVGIGLLIPKAVLHIVVSDHRTPESNINLKLDRLGDNTVPPEIQLRKARGDYDEGQIEPVLVGDELGQIGGYGQYLSTTQQDVGMSDLSAYIRIIAAENFSLDNWGSEMVFGTTPIGSGTAVERMKIHADGGITIGSPTGGSQGAGTLNVENGVFVNGTPV